MKLSHPSLLVVVVAAPLAHGFGTPIVMPSVGRNWISTQHYSQNDILKKTTSKLEKRRDSSTPLWMSIVSPFDESSTDESTTETDDEFLELTLENVETVLDEMRPYLIQDGGNVAVSDIDGPVVKLELQGACGTCPSSTMTMRMGLEKRLRERIPEIQEVIQSIPDGPPLDEEQVASVLDGVRPFLQVAGGSIDLVSITGEGGFAPQILLKMDGRASSIRSVKMEIIQRLQRHFMIPMLRIEFADLDSRMN